MTEEAKTAVKEEVKSSYAPKAWEFDFGDFSNPMGMSISGIKFVKTWSKVIQKTVLCCVTKTGQVFRIMPSYSGKTLRVSEPQAGEFDVSKIKFKAYK